MGFVDGRNLEDRSVALIKMEVDVATSAQLNQEIADRIAGDAAQGSALSAHEGIALADAPHAGPINSSTQISDSSVAMVKLSFTPALQSDFLAHIGDGSIHFTLGTTNGQAARGDHNHTGGHGSGLDADMVDGEHASAFVHVGGGSGTITPGQIVPQGHGSGLDSDMVDGLHAAAFAPVVHTHPSGPGSGLDADTLDGIDSTGFSTVGHTHPSGPGSGLDADTLDGIDSTGFALAGSGVTSIVAGTNVTISPPGGTGAVTVNATSSGFQNPATESLNMNTWGIDNILWAIFKYYANTALKSVEINNYSVPDVRVYNPVYPAGPENHFTSYGPHAIQMSMNNGFNAYYSKFEVVDTGSLAYLNIVMTDTIGGGFHDNNTGVFVSIQDGVAYGGPINNTFIVVGSTAATGTKSGLYNDRNGDRVMVYSTESLETQYTYIDTVVVSNGTVEVIIPNKYIDGIEVSTIKVMLTPEFADVVYWDRAASTLTNSEVRINIKTKDPTSSGNVTMQISARSLFNPGENV